MTQFTGISFGAIKDRVCVIACSNGVIITKREGMNTREVIATLIALRKDSGLRTQDSKTKQAFVVYDSSVDFELAFRDLTRADKDKLFGIWRQKEDKYAQDTPLYEWNRRADAIEFEGLRVSYLTGKICRISQPKRSGLTIYDIAGYFENADIATSAREFLSERPPTIQRQDLALWKDAEFEQVIERCEAEAQLIVRLAEKVEQVILPLQINNRQWYGPSAIASRCLSKWKARRQGKRLTERNAAHELIKAIDCAYFGGRVEAVKLGTVHDVSVFDLNSAYAYATTLLSRFAKPLRFSRDAKELNIPFSVWFCEYELPGDAILGVMPTRAPRGSISFRRRGKGYFWQPEIEYLARRYPGSYKIGWGYVARDAEPISFAKDVQAMYDYRQELKAQGDAGQKIIKLALSNLYGKFAQNTGGAFYQCRAWAGWITSYIRRMLLEAVTGIEDKVVCFAQDAIHVDRWEGARAPVAIGEGLGQWKQSDYASGLYLAPGIYDLKSTVDGELGKVANRGSNLDLDFQRIGQELSDRQASELQRVFFVGYALASQATVKYGVNYLSEVSESLQLIPGRLRARSYDTRFDWLKESRTSRMSDSYSGLMSSRYFPQEQSVSLRLRLKDRGWV